MKESHERSVGGRTHGHGSTGGIGVDIARALVRRRPRRSSADGTSRAGRRRHRANAEGRAGEFVEQTLPTAEAAVRAAGRPSLATRSVVLGSVVNKRSHADRNRGHTRRDRPADNLACGERHRTVLLTESSPERPSAVGAVVKSGPSRDWSACRIRRLYSAKKDGRCTPDQERGRELPQTAYASTPSPRDQTPPATTRTRQLATIIARIPPAR